MEGLGAFLDGECDSFSGMFSAFSRDESVGDLCISSNLSFEANMNISEGWFCSLDALNFGMHEFDRHERYMAMDIDMPELKTAEKRLRDSKDKIPKNASKKIRSDGSEEEGKSPSGCSSEDDIASPQTPLAPALLTGKRRPSTGPQSLYARKRREKINERLRTLQSLVPNGTKVDMSTMLEEAVHYVKFLELQIKLLSSDDMWMYSPVAYNGMDIAHTRNTSQ